MLATRISRIKLGILNPDEIRKMSVTQIVTSEVYNNDGTPVDGGVMDRRLGAIEPGERCPTCGNTRDSCPGHFGHIELVKPVIHPNFTKHILYYLKSTCRRCGRLKIPESERQEYLELLKDLEEFKLLYLKRQFHEYIRRKASAVMECPHCGAQQFKIKLEKPYTFYEESKEGSRKLSASEIRAWLEKIPDEDVRLLGGDPKEARPEWMVLIVLPVPPRTVRPSVLLETGIRSEDDLTHKLVDIIRINNRLREHLETGAPQAIIEEEHDLLQYHVATYFDNEIPGVPQSKHRSGKTLKGIAQRLKGKEGRFRNNLRGKRVDFSARTVISPDPNLSINEVGVPEEIAKILTVPEKVTPWNLEKMRKLVLNGPEKWPGANYIIRPDGRKISLKYVDRKAASESLAPGYIVERHLMDGDIVLFNRQPSLHRMSVMAHVVRVLPYKTFRLNLLVCPPYNADFDGDEMNLHVPQSEEARAEARLLMLVEKHILTPRYGGPIIGGLQDYISGAYLLTSKSTILRLEDVVDLLSVTGYRGELPEPAILKPERYWTGKQLISLFLPKDFNYRRTSKIGSASFLRCIDEDCPHDSIVIVRNGILLEGVLDKASIGREEPGSLVHWLIKEHGENVGREFMDRAYKMFIRMSEKFGLTMGYQHLTLPPEGESKLNDIIRDKREKIVALIMKYKFVERCERNLEDVISAITRYVEGELREEELKDDIRYAIREEEIRKLVEKYGPASAKKREAGELEKLVDEVAEALKPLMRDARTAAVNEIEKCLKSKSAKSCREEVAALLKELGKKSVGDAVKVVREYVEGALEEAKFREELAKGPEALRKVLETVNKLASERLRKEKAEEVVKIIEERVRGKLSQEEAKLIWRGIESGDFEELREALRKVVRRHKPKKGDIEAALRRDVERALDSILARYRSELDSLSKPGKTLKEALEDEIIDSLSKRLLDSVADVITPYFTLVNPVVIMARTGARGNPVNLTQMAALLGQQTVRGKRLSRGYLSRVLPHFERGDMGPEAGGFIASGFVHGLSPIEMFFHTASGREGLIDTAVRTSQSGYMQRRLINALQDLRVFYDGTVRAAGGEVVQLLYGEDGVDPMKSDHGKPVDIDRIIESVLGERP